MNRCFGSFRSVAILSGEARCASGSVLDPGPLLAGLSHGALAGDMPVPLSSAVGFLHGVHSIGDGFGWHYD